MPLGAAADDSLKSRYMAACQLRFKAHVCECSYDPSLNEKEMELSIAYLTGDKQRQEEIKSDPAFDYDAYNAKGAPSMAKAMACVLARRR